MWFLIKRNTKTTIATKLSFEIEIVHELKEMEHHRDDNDLTLKVIKMDLEEIANCLNNIMDDFLKEYKEMEHELDYRKIYSIEIVQGHSEELNESLVAKSEMDNILTATGYAK